MLRSIMWLLAHWGLLSCLLLACPLQLSSANALGFKCLCMCAVAKQSSPCLLCCCLPAHVAHTHHAHKWLIPCPACSFCLLPCLSLPSGAAQAGAGAGSGAGGAATAGEMVVICVADVLVFPCRGCRWCSDRHLCPAVLFCATPNVTGALVRCFAGANN